MLVSIALAVVAFAVTMAALCYDPVDRRFRFLVPFRDDDTGAFRVPERPVLVILGGRLR